MLRFRLGRIPIEVHPSHLLVSAFFGLSLLEVLTRQARGDTWPGSVLVDRAAPGYMATAAAVVALWVGVVFVSALVHELGHAVVRRLFGYEASISLVWLGGVTRAVARGPIPWHHDVLSHLAGPLFGLALGLVSLGALRLSGHQGGVLEFLLTQLALANLIWAAVNLVPVVPLDGGLVSLRVSVRLFGRRGLLLSQLLGLTITAALVAWAVVTDQVLLALFFVLFGMQTVRLLQAYFRGEGLPGLEGVEEVPPRLQEAEAHLAEGRLTEAAREARALLEDERLLPMVASRAHLLLGWVALKEGQGRRALDHFSQVHGVRVPAHALAAAFSLVGDEPKARPVWEMAWQQTREATVLHEWAGSLIRSGLVERARRLPGVDLAAAYACATRVLFIRGAFSEAAALGEQALLEAPRADLAYEAACAYARAGNPEGALRMLERAAALGFDDRPYAASDEDLARLHGHPGFDAWLSRLPESAAS